MCELGISSAEQSSELQVPEIWLEMIKCTIKLGSNTNVRLGRVEGGLSRRADNLSAERLEHVNLLLGHLLGQGDHHLVALHRSGQGQANTRVTAK